MVLKKSDRSPQALPRETQLADAPGDPVPDKESAPKRAAMKDVPSPQTEKPQVELPASQSPQGGDPPEKRQEQGTARRGRGELTLFDLPRETDLLADPTEDAPAMDRDQRLKALEKLCREVARCQRCAELVANRTQTVFGTGDPEARLCFVGEAPGADEDRQGEPFVGRAGQLLTRMIQACTLQRDQVYICNVLKCRPPGNRTPTPEEIRNCRGYLEAQLEIIRPQFICCLGSVAAQTLLNTRAPLGKLRGRLHRYRQSVVVVTYHPAYLLRNPDAKWAAWEDLTLLMKEMGIPVPKKKPPDARPRR